jgi:hypothetical protein
VARDKQPPEQLTSVLFGLADRDRDGRISFDELEAVVKKRPELLAHMTANEAMWILPNEDLAARLDAGERVAASRGALERGWLPALFVVAWALAHAGIFAFTMANPPGGSAPNLAMQIGRALGKCIDLDGALILVPMMRRLLTGVRRTWLGRAIPVDDAIAFHRLVGNAMFALALAHAGAFTAAFLVGHSPAPVTQLLFATARGLTGLALLLVFAVMWAFALAPIRRSRRFELFYFTHLLYVAWLAIAIAHAPSFLVACRRG